MDVSGQGRSDGESDSLSQGGSPRCLWWQGLGHCTTEAEEPSSLGSLSWPFREPPGLCRKGKGPKLGEGVAGRGELCGQGAAC